MQEPEISAADHVEAFNTLILQGGVEAAAALQRFEEALADEPFNFDVSQARCGIPEDTVSLLLPTVSCDPTILEQQSRGKANKAARVWGISTPHLLFLVARDCSNQGKPFFTRLYDFASRCPDRHAAFKLLCDCVAYRRANTRVKRQGLRRQKRGIILDDIVVASRILDSPEHDAQSGPSPTSVTTATPPTPEPEASRALASAAVVSLSEISVSHLSLPDSFVESTQTAAVEAEQQPPDHFDPFERGESDEDNNEPETHSSSRPEESFDKTDDGDSSLRDRSINGHLGEGQELGPFGDLDRDLEDEDDFGRFGDCDGGSGEGEGLTQQDDFDANPEPSRYEQQSIRVSAVMSPASSHARGLSFLSCANSRGKHSISGPSSPTPTKKPRLEFADDELDEIFDTMLDKDAKLSPKVLDAALERLIQACSQRAFVIRSSEIQAMLEENYIPQSDIREAISAEKMLIFPMSLDNGHHWALAILQPQNNTLATTDFYDSSPSELHLKEAKDALLGFRQHYFGDSLRLSSRGLFPCACPGQDGEADSGVITFACVLHILTHRPLPAKAPIMLWRFVIADCLDLSRQEEDGLDWDTLIPDDNSDTPSEPTSPEPNHDEGKQSPRSALAALRDKHRRLEKSMETRLHKMYQSRIERIEPVRNNAVAVLAVLTAFYSNATANVSSWAVHRLVEDQKERRTTFEEARQSYERLGVTLGRV